MKKVDEIIDRLKDIDVVGFDEDAMVDAIMGRIEKQESEAKTIAIAPKWLEMLRGVSSAAAVVVLGLMVWGGGESATSDMKIYEKRDIDMSLHEVGEERAPGEIYASYLQRKEALKSSYRQLIRKYNEKSN
ncbi:MAG: hypothetical protein Q4C30_07100 [Bacteroidia bacterium]|nr:hypothetical protein [Bacteroidia bacterium]